MTRKRAELLTGYEVGTLAGGVRRVRVGAFTGEELIAEASHVTERLALKMLVDSVYRLHCSDVFKQYGGRCSRCQFQRALSFHHKRHRSQGGTHEKYNLEPVCWDCHRMIHETERSL